MRTNLTVSGTLALALGLLGCMEGEVTGPSPDRAAAKSDPWHVSLSERCVHDVETCDEQEFDELAERYQRHLEGVASTYESPSRIGFASEASTDPDGSVWMSVFTDLGTEIVVQLKVWGPGDFEYALYTSPATEPYYYRSEHPSDPGLNHDRFNGGHLSSLSESEIDSLVLASGELFRRPEMQVHLQVALPLPGPAPKGTPILPKWVCTVVAGGAAGATKGAVDHKLKPQVKDTKSAAKANAKSASAGAAVGTVVYTICDRGNKN